MSSDRSEDAVFTADSVDEFVERMRHRQLLEAKQDAAATLRNAVALQQRATAGRAAEEIRHAVAQYVLEAEALYRRTEPGKRLWNEVEIDTIPVLASAPVDGEEVASVDRVRPINGPPVGERHGRRVLPVVGVKSFLEADEWRARLIYQSDIPGRGAATETKSVTFSPAVPISTSREAFRATNALLHQLDMGVRMSADDGTGTVDTDYTELLDRLTTSKDSSDE
ncbi:hypothetical protein [Halobaculum sp. D14]|uniref:hypothetical protein n=1 Tax=Halobaculum sp. D14 TaxID=3421642 RepID=UPI003EBF9B7B